MADTKITALTALTAADPASDVLPIVDISDTTMAASGTTKKISVNNILGAGGTATLASATITGDLTVDTSTLKVDSTNNRVGVRTATPRSPYALDVLGNVALGDSTTTSGVRLKIDGAGTAGNVPTILFASAGVSKAFFGLSGAFLGDTSTDAFIGTDAAGAAIRFYVSDTGTEAMRLNSTGLGVGVTPSYRLDVSSSSNIVGRISSSSVFNTGFNIVNTTGATWSLYSFGSNDATLQNSFGIYHQSGTSFLQITQAGNVGVGVTPSAWGSGFKALEVGRVGSGFFSVGATSLQVTNNFYYNGTNYIYSANGAATRYHLVDGSHQWHNAASGTAGNTITFTQAMTLDASGNLFVGKTATGLSTAGIQSSPSGWIQATVSGDASLFTNRLGSDGKTVQLYRETLEVGNISVTTTGATFNSTSDYRLKEAVAPLSGGLARVNALKPSVYKWKSNGLSGEGFLAHELADVVPAAVTGEKDAVNEDGSIKAQSIDMSRVVPILVAAIQELTARVQTLEAK
jgi:hypothetical protein